MANVSKRQKAINEQVDAGKVYEVSEGLDLLKSLSEKTKFNESVDAAIQLGVDARKSDQMVRGAVLLPHGSGKTVRVGVFAEGDAANDATEAGADRVGLEDLAESFKKGPIDVDVVIATPAAMKVVGKLGQLLGPKGLMPNPKVGTVTADIKTAVNNAKAGQVQYRTEKAGIIHAAIGKADFSSANLKDNLSALVEALKKAKPSQAKGTYLKKLTLSTTMGPGISVDVASLEAK